MLLFDSFELCVLARRRCLFTTVFARNFSAPPTQRGFYPEYLNIVPKHARHVQNVRIHQMVFMNEKGNVEPAHMLQERKVAGVSVQNIEILVGSHVVYVTPIKRNQIL